MRNFPVSGQHLLSGCLLNFLVLCFLPGEVFFLCLLFLRPQARLPAGSSRRNGSKRKRNPSPKRRLLPAAPLRRIPSVATLCSAMPLLRWCPSFWACLLSTVRGQPVTCTAVPRLFWNLPILTGKNCCLPVLVCQYCLGCILMIIPDSVQPAGVT